MSHVYLVTGGAGFIGSAIARQLRARGEKVRVLDNFSSGNRDNLAEEGEVPPSRHAIEVLEGDILNAESLERAMAGATVVFHEAAIASVPRSIADPGLTNEVNVTGTLRVLQAARRAGVSRVVYAASSSAYGDTPELPKVETMAPLPQSPYAVTKLTGEYYCRNYHEVFGLPTVSLRYFNVFGPRQDPGSEYAAVIPRFIVAALNGRPVIVYGDGEQTRDFCFIEDVVAANLAAAESPNGTGCVFNVARGRGVSLNQLLACLEPIVGHEIERRYEPARAGDVRHSVADVTAAAGTGAGLSFRAAVSLEEGLARTVDWFRGGGAGVLSSRTVGKGSPAATTK